ncbi:MAG: rod shape-determining protein MreC [Alteromonadaceae bacterium]|nr:MAG: rod shape-determining protein MreC [Alteromonadaceae bacterium]
MKPLFTKGPSPIVRITVLVLVSVTISLAYALTDWLSPLKKRAIEIAEPFYRISDIPDSISGWLDDRFMSGESLAQENKALRTEVLVLKRELLLNASLAAENIRLRRLLNSANTLDDRVLIAELIGVSPDPSVHQVIVNRGSEDGVYKGQALLDAQGLMGQVVEVGKTSSKVLLITDIMHELPVQINRNGVRLIAAGMGDLYRLRLPHVANTMDVVVGDMLVSSGLGQRFPVGYPVAEVTQVTVDPAKRFATVTARPMAEMNRSRHVLLVFDRPPSS